MCRRVVAFAVLFGIGFSLGVAPARAAMVFTPGNIFMLAGKESGDPADPSSLIVEFTPDGDLVRFFDAGPTGRDMEFRDKFHLYATSYGSLHEFTPDGAQSRSLSVGAHGIGIGPEGYVYAAHRGGNTVRQIDTWQPSLTQVGSITTSGVDGNNAFDVAVPESGKIYVAHYGDNAVHRYDAGGTLEASGWADHPHSIAASPDGQEISALGNSVYRLDPDLNPMGDWTHNGRAYMNFGEDGRLYIGSHSQLLYSRNADGSDHQAIASGTADFTFGNSLYRAMSAQTAPGQGVHMFVAAARWAGDPNDPGDTTPWWQSDGGAIFEFDEAGQRVRVLHDDLTSYARGMGSLGGSYIAVNAAGLKVMNAVTGEFVASGGGCDGVNVGTNGLIYTAVRGSKLIQEYGFDANSEALTLLRTLSTQAPAGGGSDTIDVAANDEYFYVAYYLDAVQQYRLSDGSWVNEWIDPGGGNIAHSITIDPRTGNVVVRGTGGDVRWFDPDTLALLGQGPWDGYTTFIGFGPDDLLYTAGALTSGSSMSLGEIRVGTPGQDRWLYIGTEGFVYNGRRYWASDISFAVVPEPGSLLLLAFGGVGILLVRVSRRRR